MPRTIVILVLALTGTSGCVRRDGRNSDCIWPGEPGAHTLNPEEKGYRSHLAADADFAEQLADQYGLRIGKPGNRQSFIQAKERCLENMFAGVATTHSVAPAEVFKYWGTNRASIDLLLDLPFVFLYAFASLVMARHIWSRCPPSEGWLIGTVLVLLCSLAFGLIGVLLGEQWSAIMEGIRLGTGHLGIRLSRLTWARHPRELFVGLAMLFCAVAAMRRRSSGETALPSERSSVLGLADREARF